MIKINENFKIIATNPAQVMADVQTFLGVDNYLSEDKFVINDETGYYCFKKSREADIVCLPEEKVQTMSGSKKNHD